MCHAVRVRARGVPEGDESEGDVRLPSQGAAQKRPSLFQRLSLSEPFLKADDDHGACCRDQQAKGQNVKGCREPLHRALPVPALKRVQSRNAGWRDGLREGPCGIVTAPLFVRYARGPLKGDRDVARSLTVERVHHRTHYRGAA